MDWSANNSMCNTISDEVTVCDAVAGNTKNSAKHSAESLHGNIPDIVSYNIDNNKK